MKKIHAVAHHPLVMDALVIGHLAELDRMHAARVPGELSGSESHGPEGDRCRVQDIGHLGLHHASGHHVDPVAGPCRFEGLLGRGHGVPRFPEDLRDVNPAVPGDEVLHDDGGVSARAHGRAVPAPYAGVQVAFPAHHDLHGVQSPVLEKALTRTSSLPQQASHSCCAQNPQPS